jgi:hypothetical protein
VTAAINVTAAERVLLLISEPVIAVDDQSKPIDN